MGLVSPSKLFGNSPFKDVTNSIPTPLIGAGPYRKITKSKRKRSTLSPQRRSTRLNSLRSDTEEAEEKVEEIPSVRTTRSGRKLTPGLGGSATSRKRNIRKHGQECSNAAQRKRRSVSGQPSSPLDAKSNLHGSLLSPTTPPLTRLTRSSTRPESPIHEISHEEISIIVKNKIVKSECKKLRLC